MLEKAVEKFKSAGINVNAISIAGDARQVIEAKIEELKPNFVIMGSRSLGPVDRVLVGSVSEHMLHYLSMPVIIVPLKST